MLRFWVGFGQCRHVTKQEAVGCKHLKQYVHESQEIGNRRVVILGWAQNAAGVRLELAKQRFDNF
jgi:lysine/ornithine N-monooxygenase